MRLALDVEPPAGAPPTDARPAETMLEVRLQRLLGTIVAATACLVLLPDPVEAASPEDPDRHYNGAFRQFDARGAWLPSTTSRPTGWGFDLGFRHASVMMLADARASYTFASLPGGSGTAGRQRHGAWVHGLVHPLFASLLGSKWFGYVVGSLAFEIGVGATLEASEAAPVRFGGAWSLGVGLDIPITDPDRGRAAWLLFNYRHVRPFARPRAARHALFAGIGWRMNGSLF